MKKVLLTLLMIVASLSVQAYDYPYLAFQHTDGTIKTLSVESLTITVSNGQLVATNGDGSTTFTLSDLSKMYFSTEGTTGINTIENSSSAGETEIYDLQGRKVSRSEMKTGIYVIKTKNGTRKVNVK